MARYVRLTRGSGSCITCRAFRWRHPGRRLEFDRGLTSPVVSSEPANASSTAKFGILDRRSKCRSVWATPGGATFWAAALSGRPNLLRTVELCRGTWFRVHCGNHLADATLGFLRADSYKAFSGSIGHGVSRPGRGVKPTNRGFALFSCFEARPSRKGGDDSAISSRIRH